MRVEIMVGNSDEPMIYPLNKPKLTIGSVESCDIVITSTSVSRKHLNIVVEDESFFVVDQGSTNGTFINEERLVPGRKVEFTSFFPIRLGDDVLITLLSDEEDSVLDRVNFPTPKERTSPKITLPVEDQNSTRVISLKELNKTKTTDLVKKRDKVLKRNTKISAPAKVQDKERLRMTVVKVLVVAILGGATYVNLYMREEEEPALPVAQMGQVVDAPKAENKKAQVVESKLIDDADLVPLEKFSQLLTDLKCTTDSEKYVCQMLPDILVDKRWGAVQTGTMVNILIDGTKYFEEAKTLLPSLAIEAPAKDHQEYKEHMIKVAALLFMLRGVPKDFNYDLVQNLRLSVAFFQKTEAGEYVPKGALAVLPEAMKEIKSSVTDLQISSIKRIGPGAIKFTEHLFKTY